MWWLEASGFEIRVKMTEPYCSGILPPPPSFLLRKCHLVENMMQRSNLSQIRSEFGVRMDWQSILQSSSILCICVFLSVRMNLFVSVFDCYVEFHRKWISKWYWCALAKSTSMSNPPPNSDLFRKKVPKSEYFWRFCRTFWELPSSRYSSRGSLIMFYAPPYINAGSRPPGVRPESRTEERNSDFFGIFGSALVSKLWEKSPLPVKLLMRDFLESNEYRKNHNFTLLERIAHQKRSSKVHVVEFFSPNLDSRALPKRL